MTCGVEVGLDVGSDLGVEGSEEVGFGCKLRFICPLLEGGFLFDIESEGEIDGHGG